MSVRPSSNSYTNAPFLFSIELPFEQHINDSVCVIGWLIGWLFAWLVGWLFLQEGQILTQALELRTTVRPSELLTN